MFDEALPETKLSAWQSLKSVPTNLLGNHWNTEYEKENEELQKSFCKHKAQISVKLHFLLAHLDYFPKNCGDLSEEQGECFHQDICIIEHIKGRWDVNFLADYCRCLKQDAVADELTRMSLKIPFIHE